MVLLHLLLLPPTVYDWPTIAARCWRRRRGRARVESRGAAVEVANPRWTVTERVARVRGRANRSIVSRLSIERLTRWERKKELVVFLTSFSTPSISTFSQKQLTRFVMVRGYEIWSTIQISLSSCSTMHDLLQDSFKSLFKETVSHPLQTRFDRIVST